MERKSYLDILRIAATFAVIALHVASKQMGSEYVGILLVYDGLVRWAVPMFVMISGTLFLDLDKKVPIKKMWSKNILRMAIALLFWTIVYCIYEYSINGLDAHGVKMYLITGYWHMWFVIMIIGLYMLTPIIRCISANRPMTKYFLILAFVFAICIPSLQSGVIPFTSLAGKEGVDKLFADVATLNLQFLMGYTSYYLLGYYLSTCDIPKRIRCVFYLVGVLGFALNILGNEYLTSLRGVATQPFSAPLGIAAWMQCVGLFVFAKYHLNIKKKRVEKTVITVSNCCFGIYLVHILLREAFDKFFMWNALTLNPLFAVPLLAAVIFFAGFVLSWLLRKIPIVGRYVV